LRVIGIIIQLVERLGLAEICVYVRKTIVNPFSELEKCHYLAGTRNERRDAASKRPARESLDDGIPQLGGGRPFLRYLGRIIKWGTAIVTDPWPPWTGSVGEGCLSGAGA